MVCKSCVKCDRMWLLSASQHHFPATYQIEFKELTMTTTIVDIKYIYYLWKNKRVRENDNDDAGIKWFVRTIDKSLAEAKVQGNGS